MICMLFTGQKSKFKTLLIKKIIVLNLFREFENSIFKGTSINDWCARFFRRTLWRNQNDNFDYY